MIPFFFSFPLPTFSGTAERCRNKFIYGVSNYGKKV
nr:MAG TPA: hypothetical protein [Caudovirales sp. ctMlE25]